MKIKNTGIAFLVLILFTSCTAQKSLYNWGKYDQASYLYLKKNDEKATLNLIKTYEQLIDNQKKGIRQTVPPGIYADYGLILLKSGEVTKGKKMLKQEKILYPESKLFIDKILKMYTK